VHPTWLVALLTAVILLTGLAQAHLTEPPELSDVTVRLSDLLPVLLSLLGTLLTAGLGAILWVRRELRAEIRDLWEKGVDPLRKDVGANSVLIATLTERLDVAKKTTRQHSQEIVFPRGSEERILLRRWGAIEDLLDMPTEDLESLRQMCEDILTSGRGLEEKATALSTLREIKDELVVRASRDAERLISAHGPEEA